VEMLRSTHDFPKDWTESVWCDYYEGD